MRRWWIFHLKESDSFPVETAGRGAPSKIQQYTPVELRKPFLIVYCVLVLIAFTLLQLGAAAFSGAPYVGYLVPRSAQESCPPGATCAPAPGSWSNPNSYPTIAPGAPNRGSFTNPNRQSEGWASGYYFVGGYLPTLTAILLSIWWKSVFVRLKEMEPIYQLFQRDRTPLAKNSTLLSYNSASLPKLIISSLISQLWLTWLGAVNMALILVCTAFASETVFISTTGSGCHVIIDPTGPTNNDCQMHLSMRPPLAWALGAVLFAIFLITVLLIFRLRRQASGITAEASSIVGVGVLYRTLLANNLVDYDRVSSDTTSENNTMMDTAYLPPTSYEVPQPQPRQKGKKRVKDNYSMRPTALVLFWLYLVAVLILVLYYRFVSTPGTNNHFEDFMNSQSFGVNFFMACVGLAIKLYWGAIEKHIRSITPYARMAALNGASADRSVLIPKYSHPIAALFFSSSWRDPLLQLVTLSAVLSEILVITLNTIPFSTSTAYLAFDISVYISTGIIAVMLITIPSLVISRLLGGSKTAGKAPECIADVFALLGHDLRNRFGALQGLDRRGREQVVNGWGFRYLLESTGKDEQYLDGHKRIVAYCSS